MGAWFPDERDPAIYSFFAIRYYDAAISLGKIVIKKHDKFRAIPMLALLRHAFELQLKALVYATSIVDRCDTKKACVLGHDLMKPKDWLVSKGWVFDVKIDYLIDFLNDLDPRATGLRYPEEKNGRPSGLMFYRSPGTCAFYRLGRSYRNSLSVNKLLREMRGKEAHSFFWGYLDAFTEEGLRG